MVSAESLVAYLKRYITHYRREYERLVADPPDGAGFPRVPVSPYLGDYMFSGWICPDGVAITCYEQFNEYRRIDKAFTINSPPVDDPSIADRYLGRLVATSGEDSYATIAGGGIATASRTQLRMHAFSDWLTFGSHIHFGAGGNLQSEASDFWNPTYLAEVVCAILDTGPTRYFRLIEIHVHTDAAAWDPRAAWARARVDVLRDYAFQITNPDSSFMGQRIQVKAYAIVYDRLAGLAKAIEQFEMLLREQGEAHESKFHKFLLENPLLLDAYGTPHSKPQWRYPEGKTSVIGKTYVEPDFVFSYSWGDYLLVELERPNKRLATQSGEPRAETNQALWQIKEWKEYLAEYSHLLQDKFRSIKLSNCKSMVVIGRASEKSVGPGRDVRQYLQTVRPDTSTDIFTYDDLLSRARDMYSGLKSMWFSNSPLESDQVTNE